MKSDQTAAPRTGGVIVEASVAENVPVCREHYKLTLAVSDFPDSVPGQFVRITPQQPDYETSEYRKLDWPTDEGDGCVEQYSEGAEKQDGSPDKPFLPRAFSIGGLRRTSSGCEIDLLYRVVGLGTTWMESLTTGDKVDILGPLGNGFPAPEKKGHCWLVAGGVGTPPLLWLAESLNRDQERRNVVAFMGARNCELIPLHQVDGVAPAVDAATASPCFAEFAAVDTPMVISTDDGSIGYRGNVVAALGAYHQANPIPAEEIVVYTCGPEIMMRAAADYCRQRGIACYVCMERSMACGVGTCQSCIVKVGEDGGDRWQYKLCCTDGPVFDARNVVWDG